MTQNNRERLRQAQASAARQQRLTRIIGVGAAVLVLVVVGVLVGVLIQGMNAGGGSTSAPPNATADGKAIVVNPGKAKDGAPVVELFFDYQCPACSQFETAYGAALTTAAEAGEIDLRYRTMTFLDANLGNDASIRTGVAAACADVAGSYSAYHDAAFANQPKDEGSGYSDDLLRDLLPVSVGISGDELTAFQACYDTRATKKFVTGTNDLGTQDLQAISNRVSTPSLHVNGKDLSLTDVSVAGPEGLLELIRQRA